MGAVDWEQLLGGAERPAIVTAETFLKKWETASKPVLLTCTDGEKSADYVVKGRQAGRRVANDQVIARLGIAVGAPVGEPAWVDVPQDLIDNESEMAHMAAGLAHGTFFLVGYTERMGYDHATEGDNKERFAALAILFGWIQAQDHQFIYENSSPHTVNSVDHSECFPGDPDWTIASLAGAAPPVADAGVIAGASLTDAEIAAARQSLHSPTDGEIAAALAAVHESWGLSTDELVALARYLADRRDVIFT